MKIKAEKGVPQFPVSLTVYVEVDRDCERYLVVGEDDLSDIDDGSFVAIYQLVKHGRVRVTREATFEKAPS